MKQWMVGVALVALAAGSAPAAAQSAVGARAGIRWAGVQSAQTSGALRSPVLGGYFGFGVSDRLAIQIEAVYGARGGTRIGVTADDLDPDATESEIDMSYVEFPLLLRAGFPGERLLPSLFLGPYAAFLLNCDLTPSGGEARPCDEPDAAARFAPRSTDVGLIIGAALDVAVGDGAIFLDSRYSLGLLSLEAGDGFDARHSGIAVSGGFAIPLGR